MESVKTNATVKFHSKIIYEGFCSAVASYREYLKHVTDRQTSNLAIFYLYEALANFNSAEVLAHATDEISEVTFLDIIATFEYFKTQIICDIKYNQVSPDTEIIFNNLKVAYEKIKVEVEQNITSE